MRYAHAYSAGLLALAICATCDADRPRPLAKLDPDAPAYVTLDAAARGALKLAARESRRYEYGGLIIECEGQFRYTSPVTSHQSVRLTFDFMPLPDCRIAAIYHTHPSRDVRSHLHSQIDMDAARQLAVPSYIVVMQTGEIRVWSAK